MIQIGYQTAHRRQDENSGVRSLRSLTQVRLRRNEFAAIEDRLKHMNVVFRADANHNIGMGHIMRCLSIADAFQTLGHNVSFIIADEGISSLIKQRGYEAVILNSDYRIMEEELKLWPELTPDLIIVDSYYVTATYLCSLREKLITETGESGKLVYIDDVYSFPYPVDILVDYNAYASLPSYSDLYRDRREPEPQLILEPTYAPLRSMFRNIPKKVQKDRVENILISTGGSDELHLALAILRAVISSVRSNHVYHFLIGAMNADKDEIKKVAAEVEWVQLHENVTDMRSLIEGMDLVISAAGSTLYEICACGVPLITFSTADNQIPGAEAFDRLGLGINAGDLRDPDSIDHNAVMSGKLRPDAVELILTEAEKLADDYQKRALMGTRMQELIDGFGADRMVQKILSFC